MADDEENLFRFIKHGVEGETKSSRDYTGRGTAYYPNEEIYEGDYKKGLRTGKGVYQYKKLEDIDPDQPIPAVPKTYEGDFYKNKKHGIGKMTYFNDETYYGQWENGKKHGEGIYTYLNGDTYSGWFAFGKKHGFGTYTFKQTQQRLVGEFEENKFIKGKWILPNGNYFEGEFQNNLPNGNGKWYFKNKNTVEGQFKQEKLEQDDDTLPPAFKLDWSSQSDLHKSASLVNDHFNF
ncbi:hypothetical protein PPERSA_08697 [Pseudocohnilembus persalinus]|uniref:MORN motif n=1 Tax=Pseudocohnilembus persalinus TaxID=266149 RepID=A0A0V0R895_PSEPJ|nr:hypothetical protein PPERSA_08697 [Pseudocohnilembus persalinus]|eukprot:KRX10702.1 hypothetical protein PPERSA_08697 [Pseudocohnilembus persalinus]